MNILIVEDSATLRAHMKKLVTELGHRPLFANSGIEALQTLGNTNFDLVIMDVEMPGLDGFETTSLMREALGDRWVPIIFSTSHDSDDRVLAGIEAGGDDFLVKPISRNLLKAKLTAMQRLTEMHQQLRRLNNELSTLSQYDGLTKILNRRAFTEKAEQALHDAQRFGKRYSILMMDVDYFKQYNDHYGHVKGDECLYAIAQALQGSVSRESDLVGRYGGEEFVVFLPDTNEDGAKLVAERILKAIDAQNIPHKLSSVAEHVTLSIGIASPNDRCTLEALLTHADKNLYEAKGSGRHRVCSDNASHKTLLIVDNSEDNLATLTRHLQPLGIIITADSSGECLELAKEIKPDLIVVSNINGQRTDLEQDLANHVRTARIAVYYIDEPSENSLAQIKGLLA